MKKTYLYIATILVFISCESKLKKVVFRSASGKIINEITYPDKLDTTSYNIKIFYESGELYKEASIIHNKFIGQKNTYYRNGKLSQIDSLSKPCDTSQKVCDGVVIRFYPNGKISQRYTVQGNIHNGMSQHFLDDGTLVKEYEILNGTLKNGLYREFYKNGQKSFEGHFTNDTLTGLSYYFYDNGDSLKCNNNVKGEMDLPYKKWLKDGLVLEGQYSKDKKSVIWTWYDSDKRERKRKVESLSKGSFSVPG